MALFGFASAGVAYCGGVLHQGLLGCLLQPWPCEFMVVHPNIAIFQRTHVA